MKKVLILACLTISLSSQACTMSPLGYSIGAIKAVMNSIENNGATIRSIKLEDRSNVVAVELLNGQRCVKQYFETTFGVDCSFKVSRGIHAERCD